MDPKSFTFWNKLNSYPTTAIQLLGFSLSTSMTVLFAARNRSTMTWLSGFTSLMFFCGMLLQLWLWRRRVSEQFESMEKRLTDLTAQLTELKSSKPQ